MSGMAPCDRCGAVVVKRHLGRHQRSSWCGKPAPPPAGHCDFCSRPAVKAIFDRLQAGELVDAVAHALGVSVRHVQNSRTRGRSAGCLPKSTHEERMVEQLERARALYGERECSECEEAFIPRLNTPEQNTCNKRCQEKRKERLKREALGLPRRAPVMGSPERLEEEMRPQRLVLAEAAIQAAAVPLLTGEASWKNWCAVLGIKEAA